MSDGTQQHLDGATHSTLTDISREIVRLYKERLGRGPTHARSHWAGDDILITHLSDTLTPAERNLVRLGEDKVLRDTRMIFQYATVAEFCEPVERITGRVVREFFSATDVERDGASIEVFVLHPEGVEAESRARPPSRRHDDGNGAAA